MEDVIEGKVTAVFNDFFVVINRGKTEGVIEGMRFAIFVEGNNIKDPITDEILGRLEIVKTKVEVIHVQEYMSSCTLLERETDKIQMQDIIKYGQNDVRNVEPGDICRSYDASAERFFELDPFKID
jgi:hypothetical protein